MNEHEKPQIDFMHIVGGVCGTVFGYVNAGPRRKRRK